MSYDISVIAINQTVPVYINSISKIFLFNEKDNENAGRYWKIWPFFSNMKGVLYTLVAEDVDGFYCSFPICDGDFEAEVPERLFPSWLSQDEKKNLTPLIIYPEYYEEFVKVIHFLIEKAPQKRIMFHTRYECESTEVVLGVIKESQFFDMLDKKEILFNVCYIVEGD